MNTSNFLILSLLSFSLLASCDSFMLDYGEPAAQFNEASLPNLGEQYLRKKITVKGIVTRHDTSDPENQRLYLSYGICCNFGKDEKMIENYRVGTIVFIDGILRRCMPNDILLDPATGRDPNAEFVPLQ